MTDMTEAEKVAAYLLDGGCIEDDCVGSVVASVEAALTRYADARVAVAVAECERLAEKAFGGPAHTYVSENADLYRGQDMACRRIAAAIRARFPSPEKRRRSDG